MTQRSELRMEPQHIKAQAPFQRCAICGESTKAPAALCSFCEIELTEEWEAEQHNGESNSPPKMYEGDVK